MFDKLLNPEGLNTGVITIETLVRGEKKSNTFKLSPSTWSVKIEFNFLILQLLNGNTWSFPTNRIRKIHIRTNEIIEGNKARNEGVMACVYCGFLHTGDYEVNCPDGDVGDGHNEFPICPCCGKDNVGGYDSFALWDVLCEGNKDIVRNFYDNWELVANDFEIDQIEK